MSLCKNWYKWDWLRQQPDWKTINWKDIEIDADVKITVKSKPQKSLKNLCTIVEEMTNAPREEIDKRQSEEKQWRETH